MGHNLESLDPERFQHLCQALLVKEFPGLSCLPVAQPDGGRDALLHVGDGQSDKFLVYQIKYSRNPLKGEDARKWVLNMADGEIEKVKTLIQRGATRYLLITNVAGTSHLDTGSIDRLHEELTSKLGISAECWWRDDLDRRLDGSWDVKLRYPEVLTGQDFLRLLMSSTQGQDQERRQRVITAFLADQYQEDFEVKFKQVELQNRLLDLFVDLPFTLVARMDESKVHDFAIAVPFPVRIRSGFASGTYALEDAADEEGGTATLLLSDFSQEYFNQLVVEGAPGQGKSTLAQYICQVQRIRWLSKTLDLTQLPPRHAQTALRLPIKADLRDLASWLSGNNPFDAGNQKSHTSDAKSLEAFLARLIQHHSGGIEFNVNDLLEVSKLAPLLIVLDGLDEVADLKGRADVVTAVSRAAPRLRENCPGLRIVVTSRPAAFANSPGFDPQHFPHVELGSVRRPQIQLYANKWMDARNLTARERAEFESILNEKMDQPHLKDLARNPMQLTILLSLIHTRGSDLPDKRTSLYDAYVDLFFSREASKSAVVRKNVVLLKDIHRYVAWVLHSSAETSRKRSSGRILSKDLRDLLQYYLKSEHHDVAVIDQIFDAMLERVVMIVSRVEGAYEFEVQPLREYFAARYLYDTASYSPPGGERGGTKPDRFNAIARNFYWLNVTRFFCGCFSKGELLDLASQIRDLNADALLGQTRYPIILSAMLLSDWVFAQTPRAVMEVASLLSSRESLRRLLPSDPYYRPDRVMQIPSQCGGSEIVEQAFLFLEDKQTRADVAWRLTEFIIGNAPSEFIQRRWLETASGSLKGETAKWLSIGCRLGAIQGMMKENLSSLLAGKELGRPELSSLLEAGRYDCVFTSSIQEEVFISRVLDGTIWKLASRTYRPPLYLLPSLFSLARYFNIPRGFAFREPLISIAVEFLKNVRSQPDELPNFSSVFENHAFTISKKFAKLLTEPSDARSFTKGMEEIVEDCRAAWGERPAVIALGLTISQLTRKPGVRVKAVDLHDRSRSLCDRLRFARSRAKDATWWLHQIKVADDADGRFLAHLSFCIWSPISVSFEAAEFLAENLDLLPVDEWDAILEFLKIFINHSFVSSSREAVISALPAYLPSDRLALLIGLREPAIYGRLIFLEYFVKNEQKSRNIAEFRQIYACEAAMAGALDWRIALSIIRSSYVEGAWANMAQISTLLRHSALPESVAQQIIAAAREYPVYLWDAAEAVASAQVRKRIRAVGKVAVEDRWFN